MKRAGTRNASFMFTVVRFSTVCGKPGALCTPPSASYGTPEMALAVADIARVQPQEAVVVMLGHDEGVLAYGPSIGAAASLLSFAVRNFLSNACSGEASCAHGACHVS